MAIEQEQEVVEAPEVQEEQSQSSVNVTVDDEGVKTISYPNSKPTEEPVDEAEVEEEEASTEDEVDEEINAETEEEVVDQVEEDDS